MMKFCKEIVVILAFLSVLSSIHCFEIEKVIDFVKDVQQQYMKAKDELKDGSTSPDALSSRSIRREAAVSYLKKIRWFLSTTKPCSDPLLCNILNHLQRLENRVGEIVSHMQRIIPFLLEEVQFRATSQTTGQVGRPSFIITKEQLEAMRYYGLAWVDIAKSLGVSLATIWRRRVRFGIDTKNSRTAKELSPSALKAFIAMLQEKTPGIGIRMVEGTLRSKNLFARRDDIAETMRLIDPVASMLRWSEQVPRVVYKVAGPNSLWHLDGNHKLIRWRLVIHGGIDGYSRVVVYLRCAANNRAETVAQLFEEATKEYCWPSRVRTDKGVENSIVARIMIEKRGEGRGSIIQGSSVHNQRIERLWRDMRRMVAEYYRQLFYFMESNDLLNPIDEVDIFCLHYVFLPKINVALKEFHKSWNSHKLSTEGGKTPDQLYLTGMLRLHGSSNVAVRDFFDPTGEVDDNYGVDEPETSEQFDENNNVTIPDMRLNIPVECLTELSQRIDTTTNHQNDHFIPQYVLSKQIVERHLS
ncbi:hypothetical protein QZH41_016767 [Actinostola sp. cb2023]|nr:hypothetical protein QZH41_016767 [Actinostola sp. cb2023]